MLVKSLLDLKSFTICLLLMVSLDSHFLMAERKQVCQCCRPLRPVFSEHPVTSLMNECHKLVAKVKLPPGFVLESSQGNHVFIGYY